ncbi:MAG: hypothetical protein WC890_00735 [Candidatus Margulisiibacteriota bacterium]
MNTNNKNMVFFWVGLLAILCFSGCSSKSTTLLATFIPQAIGSEQSIEGEGIDQFIAYRSAEFNISAKLYEKVSLFGLDLRIENKTGNTVGTLEYSVGIFDGRDHKPLTILTREQVIDYRNKIATGGSIKTGNSMVDYSIGQISGLFQTMTRGETSAYLAIIDWGINHYFAFRPIYANEDREGVLVAASNFMLEYPVAVVIKIRDKKIDLRFLPPPSKNT